MNNLYVFINHDLRRVDNIVQKLPKNWGNIQGLPFLSEEKLADLDWAGHRGFGWVKLSTFDFSGYYFQPEWLDMSKSVVKDIVAAERYDSETDTLLWGDYQLKSNERTKNAITFKLLSISDLTSTLDWKFVNGSTQITGQQLKDISTFIDTYTQSCFDLELQKHAEIDACSNASELGQLDLSITWPSKTIST